MYNPPLHCSFRRQFGQRQRSSFHAKTGGDNFSLVPSSHLIYKPPPSVVPYTDNSASGSEAPSTPKPVVTTSHWFLDRSKCDMIDALRREILERRANSKRGTINQSISINQWDMIDALRREILERRANSKRGTYYE